MKKEEVISPKNSLLKKLHSLKNEKGEIAAIEVKSGKWFLGITTIEAIQKAKEIFLGSIFYIIRIGYRTAGMLKKAIILL
ncbi:MAG: hypothetical protein HY738_14895 [Bacteroidia bacterium]|nr:hypothetical protein [Bacteroidia bacterium]